MSMVGLKFRTWCRLGLRNVATVALYRVLKRLDYYRWIFPVGSSLHGPFLSDSVLSNRRNVSLTYFSYYDREVRATPDWFLNIWNGQRYDDVQRHWSDIPDFIPALGDIKIVWEASRFDWVPRMAWAYRKGDKKALGTLELWLRDWTLLNPVNAGINWKCGQETSLRCLNLIVAALAIDSLSHHPFQGFLNLLEEHLQRIAPTVRYAMAQDNNHGISEAAALYVVGHFLARHGNGKQQRRGKRWLRNGRYWLENRVDHLVMEDGSFSQYSVTYHRLMLDVLSLVELMRSYFKAPAFSDIFYRRMTLAVIWLYGMTDSPSGDAPNLGANDGAFLFNLKGRDYRDFRPSVQCAVAVFLKQSVWTAIGRHPLLELFNINIDTMPSREVAGHSLCAEGGYVIVKSTSCLAMMRLPIYHFRPSHADALHFDLWHKGKNLLRDSGTFSYNTEEPWQSYFPGTSAHNTVQFDGRDQMPRLGRFLYGEWLRTDHVEDIAVNNRSLSLSGSYKDYRGCRHKRTVVADASYRRWKIIDEIDGFKSKAVLRWRLAPGKWHIEGSNCMSEDAELTIGCNSKVRRFELVEGWESRYYMEKSSLPVLEVQVDPGTIIITTEIALRE